MAHKNKLPLIVQIETALKALLKIGESRDEAKDQKTDHEGIYSWNTFRAYLKWCCIFANFCLTRHKCKTLKKCRRFADEWLSYLMDHYSPSTCKLAASALAKLYQCSGKDFIKTPPRKRADIKRSRGPKVRDKHFSEENHKNLVDFCKSTGLRRHELSMLRGTDLVYKDGKYYIHVRKGKGGKERLSQIIGNIGNVVDLMHKAGKNKVFSIISGGADIHGYRRDYANTFYRILARPLDTLIEDDLYVCQKDKAGVVYDRWAMLCVSENLGHNRIDVIAAHYLD